MGGVDERELRARRDHGRLRGRDTTLWPPAPEVTSPWLGWLDGLERAARHREVIDPLVESLRADAITDVILTGMGGSSLFPAVLREVCGRSSGHPELHVIDSTDPAAVLRVEASVDWSSTALIVASKSGSTVETRAHLDRFLDRLIGAVGEASRDRVIVVTDPGSPLADLAAAGRFRATVYGDTDVGGRYSALSPFGLLPASVIGADLDDLLDVAERAVQRWDLDPWSDAGPAQLATLLAEGVEAERDVLYIVVPDIAGGFGSWIEQLVAESSGKDGTGILPIVVERASDVPNDLRSMVVTIGPAEGVEELAELGIPVLVTPWDGPSGLLREAVRWMQAVALACARLGVDPFDQPDVAAAKAATSAAIASGTEPEAPVPLASLERELAHAGYVALLAYIDPGGPMLVTLERAARGLAARYGIPVTLGIGPRYLHSTGQLHKGGRGDGVHLVLVGDDPIDVEIPGRGFGFSRLKRAQAAGDLVALRQAGRRAHRIDTTDASLSELSSAPTA
jgi:transaldolase/glucose-6-phosphate isomerase